MKRLQKYIFSRLSESDFVPFFSVDPSKPLDFKEAYDITEPSNNNLQWPDGECSEFKETTKMFFQACAKLTHRILDLVRLGLKLKVSSI